MTKEQAEVKDCGVELLWNGWLNNFQTYHALQNEVEEKSVQLIEKQKELLEATRETFNKLEEKSEKASADWKNNFQNANKFESSAFSSWFHSIEEVSDKVQSFAWNPSRTAFDFLSQTQDQFAKNYKEVIKIQQEGRQEAIQSLETFAEQMKKAHKSALASIGN